MKDNVRIMEKRAELQRKGVETYQQWMKVETLTKLLDWVDSKTGQLYQKLYFRKNEVEIEFLLETLQSLGYPCKHEEEFNTVNARYSHKIILN